MRSSLIKTVLVFVLYSSVAVAAPVGTIQGRVSDSEGAAIKGAQVLFHLDSSGQTKSAPTVDIVRETNPWGTSMFNFSRDFTMCASWQPHFAKGTCERLT